MSDSHRFLFHDGPLGWKWVSAIEIAEFVNALFEAYEPRSPLEILEQYGPLSKDAVDTRDFPCWSPDLQEMIQGSGDQPSEGQDFFVPAGWALDVKRAITKREVWEVSIEIYQHTLMPGDHGLEFSVNATDEDWDRVWDEYEQDVDRPEGTIKTCFRPEHGGGIARIGWDVNGKRVETLYRPEEV